MGADVEDARVTRQTGLGGSNASSAGHAAARARPAGMCLGPGHVVVHGNAAFRETFGDRAVGVPAREGMLDLPRDAFALFDMVLRDGRPLARWVHRTGADWRLTVAPRVDPETAEVYGISFHLRERSDEPIVTPGTSRREP